MSPELATIYELRYSGVEIDHAWAGYIFMSWRKWLLAGEGIIVYD